MESYFQSALATSHMPPSGNSMLYSPHISKLIKPCPPTNKDFHCDEIHLPEGVYHLSHETSLDIAPQFATGTHATVINVQTAPNHLPVPSMASTATVSPVSSLSDEATSASISENSAALGGLKEETYEPIVVIQEEKGTITVPSASASELPIPKPEFHPLEKRLGPTTALNTETNRPAALVPPKSFSSSCIPALEDSFLTRETPLITLSPRNASGPCIDNAAVLSSENTTDESVSAHTGSSSNVGSLSSLFGRSSHKHSHHNHHHRKSKKSLIKTNSSFVLKMIVHDQLITKLANRTSHDNFLFFNVGRSFVWMDANNNPKDPLSRIVFANAYPTSHDVNKQTRSMERMDIIIGFSSGDCVWYDPIGCKYSRLNKDCVMTSSPVTMVKWIPGSEELFMVSFAEGSILVLDKNREDQAFAPAMPGCWAEYQFQATRPHKGSRYNPVAHWRVSEKGIAAFDFSPDGVNVAIVGMDGTLRIVDFQQERLTDVYSSFYGQLLCVAWSPDGRYLLTGGQDDLVTIWSIAEKRIVARCQGHKSWVSGVSFDPWKCDEGIYRFGSVGEDSRLIIWDFSFCALHRPRHVSRISTGSIVDTEGPCR